MPQFPSECNLSPNGIPPYYNLRDPSLSNDSTEVVSDSIWFCSDFIIGAGAVIIQPSSGKMVLIHDRATETWLLPKGRKDIGESVETAVIREAYEESGYHAKFLPLYIPSLAPSPDPAKKAGLNCEAIYVTTQAMRSRSHPLEYITMWYVLYIEADAIPDKGAGVINEEEYESHLVDFSDAIELLRGTQQAIVVSRAWRVWLETLERHEGKLWI